MALAIRLLKEFWLPAVAAISWTAYILATTAEAWSFKTLVGALMPSFFLASWATSQFFRVQKQERVDKNLTNIESRLGSLITSLEQHTKDFLGYSTGAGNIPRFTPMMSSATQVDLALMNDSTYPLFDVGANLVDLDEPIDPASGVRPKHPFLVDRLYPGKARLRAYTFDVSKRARLNIDIHTFTRAQFSIERIRMARMPDGMMIAAIRITSGDNIIEQTIPDNFPNYDPNAPEAVFE